MDDINSVMLTLPKLRDRKGAVVFASYQVPQSGHRLVFGTKRSSEPYDISLVLWFYSSLSHCKL